MKIKYIYPFMLLFLYSCGTLFQGYFYNTKIIVPDKTAVYDTSYYEIPITKELLYKTSDTNKYIELRTSGRQELTFVLDSQYKKFTAIPKANYLTLFFDLWSSISFFGIPLIVDFGNGNMFKFDDIVLTKDDFKLYVDDTSKFINMNDAAYYNKILLDSINNEKQGLIMDNTRLSMFIGQGITSLGLVFFIPPYGECGLKYKLSNRFDIAAITEYNLFSEGYFHSEFSGAVYRFGLESRYYPKENYGAYFSGAVNYFSTIFDKDMGRNLDYIRSEQGLLGFTLGIGFGGKWWFMEAKYSIGLEKLKPQGANPFVLHYYSFAYYFNLPL